MKALLTDNAGKLWLQDISRPTIEDYECLVRMESCAFCHSTDRHIVNGTFLETFHNPSVLGHESVGVVEQTGPKASHLAPGDRMLRAYAIYPDAVQDGIGSAWGGFAEFGKVTDWQAMVDDGLLPADKVPHMFGYMQKVPADIPLEQALLFTTLKEIYSATNHIETVTGKTFLIAGAGITACFFGLFLKRRGAQRVTMTARREEPLQFAAARGAADEVCLLQDAGRLEANYDGLVETTGSLPVTETLANTALAPEGTVYSYAVYTGAEKKEFFERLARQRGFMRVNPAEAAAHDDVSALVRAGDVDARPFVTAEFAMDEWEAAWNSVVEKTSLKTVIRF